MRPTLSSCLLATALMAAPAASMAQSRSPVFDCQADGAGSASFRAGRLQYEVGGEVFRFGGDLSVKCAGAACTYTHPSGGRWTVNWLGNGGVRITGKGTSPRGVVYDICRPVGATWSASSVSAPPATAALQAKARRHFLAEIAEARKANGQEPDFAITLTDLNGDGYPEALVVMSHSYWCGTAGCAARILDLQPMRPMVIGEFSANQLGAASSTTAGWRDVEVDGRRAGWRGQARGYETLPR